MADKPSTVKSSSHESQDDGSQAQASKIDEALTKGTSFEPQANAQRGMGKGDALMEGVGGSIATQSQGGAAAGNGNSETYPYDNPKNSLI